MVFMLWHLPSPLFGINPFMFVREVDRNDPHPLIRQEGTNYMDGSFIRISRNKAAGPPLIFRIMFNDLSLKNSLFNIRNSYLFVTALFVRVKTYFILFSLNAILKLRNIYGKIRPGFNHRIFTLRPENNTVLNQGQSSRLPAMAPMELPFQRVSGAGGFVLTSLAGTLAAAGGASTAGSWLWAVPFLLISEMQYVKMLVYQ